MELEILNKLVFIVIILSAALFSRILSNAEAFNSQICDDHCCSMGSVIHIKYYPNVTDYAGADRACTKHHRVLLSETMYNNMTECILEYLKKINASAIWLPDKLSTQSDKVSVLNLKHKFTEAKENNFYSSVCIRQDAFFKTFSLSVKENSVSQPREFDLLSPLEVLNNVSKGQSVTLKCEAEGIPITFKKNGSNVTDMNRSKTYVTTEISTDRCGDLGTFTCESEDTKSSLKKSIQIIVSCSPQLCPGEDKFKNITATSGRHSFSICVIAQANISDFLIFNNTDVFRNVDSQFDWNYQQNNVSSSYQYNITIIIKNITNLTSGDLTLGVCTSEGRDHRLNYTLVINTRLSSQKGDQNSHISPGPGTSPGKPLETPLGHNHHLAVAIPVALATVAIVLAVCCIVFVVIGVIVYRKRGKIVSSIRNMDMTDGNSSKTAESIELRSTVNVYANIQHNRSSTLVTDNRESRPLIDCEVADEQELYSTVGSVNVCADMRSIVKEKSSDKLKKLFEETLLTDKQYENMESSMARPFVCGTSDDGSSSINDEDSGRYISDGLLYITLEQAGQNRPVKLIRAKSEEKVEYAKLDFNKMDKFYKKKHKRSAGRKTNEAEPKNIT